MYRNKYIGTGIANSESLFVFLFLYGAFWVSFLIEEGKKEKRGKSSSTKSIHAIVFDNRLIGCSLHPYSTLSPLIL